MTLQVRTDPGYEFQVQARAARVSDLLSEVPRSATHIPKVHGLAEIGPDWTPVRGEGNAPVSGLMKMVATPLAEAELEKMVEQHIQNLTNALGGEV